MNLATLGIWILIIFLLGLSLDFVLRRIFIGGSYRIFVAPGVIIHELSHAFVCLLVGAKVKEISFFHKNGGYVKHEKSKVPIIGPVLITLAPLVVGIVLVFLLSKFIVGSPREILELSFSQNNLNRIYNSITHINIFNAKSLIMLYLIGSISVTMAPSLRDFANAFLGLILVFMAILAVNYFFVIRLPESQLVFAFSLVTTILIVALFFGIILAMIKSIFIRV